MIRTYTVVGAPIRIGDASYARKSTFTADDTNPEVVSLVARGFIQEEIVFIPTVWIKNESISETNEYTTESN